MNTASSLREGCYAAALGPRSRSVQRPLINNLTPVTRARPTSNKMFSAAAIAVVSEVNPDQPGASLLKARHKSILILLLLSSMISLTFAEPVLHTKTALNSAVYHNTLINITPMLFHHIELGMSYDAVVELVGKSALYCDSGESYCNADNGVISTKCLNTEFIQTNKTWMCHWEGARVARNSNPRLDIWFTGARVTHVSATMPNGNVYRRDSANNIHLEKH